jgi:hypothetical protein
MTKLKMAQVIWWDEMHKKCIIGGQQGSKATHFVQFPRDENGKIDLVNGAYDKSEVSYLNVKDEKEVRLCLGCAMVEGAEGTEGIGVEEGR